MFFRRAILIFLISMAYMQGYNVQMLSNLSFGQESSDITGFYQDGREIAVMGLQNAAVFIDVTDPYNPYEIDRISGGTSIWRDLKYWNRHVYIGTEADDGIKVVNVDNLDSPTLVNTITDVDNSHNIHIDEDGYLYIVGADGHDIWIYDLAYPSSPLLVGTWDLQGNQTSTSGYCHDIEVYNDKIYCASIYVGYFYIIDVSDKSNPYTLATYNTGGGEISTHDCAVTFDEQYLITGDESLGGHVKIWDISDYNNINLVNEYYTPGWETHSAHNLYIQENNPNMLIVSHYADGTRFLDISDPENPIEVGYYDTSEIEGLYVGNWGTYVDLPSGNIISSDIESGLYVLKFGGVSILHDALDDQPAGLFDIEAEVYSVGYELVNVDVEVCDLNDCQLYPMSSFSENNYRASIDFGDSPTVLEYAIYAEDSNNEYARYPEEGYLMFTYGDLDDLYVYDFEGTDQNWQAGWSGDNASAGIWEWGEPNPTYWEGALVQTDSDHTANGVNCFVTGNLNDPNNVGADDVDGGETTLFSPVFDLSNADEVLLTYWRWYTNNAGDNPSSDYWKVEISNDSGNSWVSIESTTLSNAPWMRQRYILSDYISFTNQMQLRFIAEDVFNDGDNSSGGSLVEAAIDDVFIQSIILNDDACDFGDLNGDQELNVLDVVIVVNIVLDNFNPSQEELCAADINQDDIVNVLDIVALINLILE